MHLGIALIIISLIYIERLLNKTKIILTETNIHRIVVASILVSIKVNDINHSTQTIKILDKICKT